VDDCQVFKTSSNGWLARFSVTIISTSFLWMDDFYHFFYILSLWMDDCHFFYILSLWMITTFSASSNGQSPLFLPSLPMGDCHTLGEEKIKTSWFGPTKWF
jgi:H+/Cl- antiporter ClcA